MSLYEKMKTASENRDVDAWLDCIHDDFVFVRHQTGAEMNNCLLYTSPSPRDLSTSRMPSSA